MSRATEIKNKLTLISNQENFLLTCESNISCRNVLNISLHTIKIAPSVQFYNSAAALLSKNLSKE